MTFSILAHDPVTGEFGAAVASRFFAVGALCTHASGRVGAVSTQALVNPMFGPAALALLEAGTPAPDVVGQLIAADPGAAQRQLHAIDAHGGIGQHTGGGCIGWAGHRHAPEVSVAGNMLTGADVLDAMLHGYQTAAGSLAGRLLAALQAGENAGGDKRGRQSAALRIHGADPVPDLDIRADDHPDPLAELRRLHRVSLERFAVFRKLMAGTHDPVGVLDRAVIEAAIARDGRPPHRGSA